MAQQKPIIIDNGVFKDLPSGEQLEVNAGTAALPAITFGDADTGLLSSGTNEVAISTNGAQRVVVDATGDVGIGTASPTARLTVDAGTASGDVAQVKSSVNGNVALSVSNATSGAAAQASLYLVTDGPNGRYGSFAVTSNAWTTDGLSLADQYQSVTATGLTNGILVGTQAANAPIVFSASSTNGTAFLASSERLRIGSTEVSVNGASSPQNVDFRVASQGNANMLFVDASADRVGVGTASPSHTVHASTAGNTEIVATTTNNSNYGQLSASSPATVWVMRANGSSIGTTFMGTSDASWITMQNIGGNGFKMGVVDAGDQIQLGSYEASIATTDVRVAITDSNIVFNGTKRNYDFRVAGDNEDNVLVVDASADKVGIGTAEPVSTVDLRGTFLARNTTDSTTAYMFQRLATATGTATGTQSGTTLQDTSKTWTVDQYIGATVTTTGGTGSGQTRQVVSNTSNTLTVTPAWSTTPVAGDTTYSVSGSAVLNIDTTNATVGVGTAVAGYRLTVEKGGSDVFAASSTSALGAGQATAWFLADAGADAKAAQIIVANSGSLGEPSRISFRDSTAAITHSAISAQRPDPAGGGEVLFSTTPAGDGAMTERMRITSAGNVGIGTASPSSLLDCQGNAAGAVTARVYNASSSAGALAEMRAAGNTANVGAIAIAYGSGNANTAFNITQNDGAGFQADTAVANLFISTRGTTAPIHIGTASNTNNKRAVEVAANAGSVTVNPDASSTINFIVEGGADANLLYVDVNNNKVGIGTASPATLLDVAGVVTANGVTIDSTDGLAVGSTSPSKYAATSPAQITADQNDYNLGTGTFFRLDSDASRNITGLANGADGRMVYLVNVGANNIVLQNQNTSSTAANRIITGTGADVTLAADNAATLIYDATTQRWRILSVQA